MENVVLTNEELATIYNRTSDNCCVCNKRLTSFGPLGWFFVMDKQGQFYCCGCDDCFDDGDERIYDFEEEC